MRRGEPPPAPDAGVLRGGALDRDVLRADAETNFAVYGFYGLSVWVPDDAAGEDALLASKLLKSRIVRRFVVASLLARGLELWDTGQSPHYDLVYLLAADVDALVDAVIATPCTTLINPHHDPDGGADR
jgi:hypothetical protein